MCFDICAQLRNHHNHDREHFYQPVKFPYAHPLPPGPQNTDQSHYSLIC